MPCFFVSAARLLLVVFAAAGSVAASEGPTVALPQGTVRGFASLENSTVFLGIPFAAPPVGALRWKSPQPAASWDGVRDATAWRAPCMQPADSWLLPSSPAASEDCLTLNVFVPPGSLSNLTVMLWIYGGSWFDGSADIPFYNGTVTAVAQSVIVVSVNYRVGVFGFGASEVLRGHNSADGSTGNYGLQDQRAAMAWVRDNIPKFGGNPNRVFVWGESAGAGSTSNHLVAPRSKGLFAAAGMESGPFAPWIAATLPVAEQRFNTSFLAPSGCVDEDPLPCLLALSSAQLVALESSARAAGAAFSPTIDGVELKEHPVNAAQGGRFVNRVPILLGTNQDEGTMFNPYPRNMTWATFDQLLSKFGSFAPQVKALYANFSTPWDAASAVIGDNGFTCPARRTARWTTAASMDTFMYYFTHLPTEPLPDCVGVCHASEFVFVFNDGFRMSTPGEHELGARMNTYWASFAADHVPSAAGAPAWPKYSLAADAVLRLDVGSNLTAIAHNKDAKCDLFDAIFAANPLPNAMRV